MKSNQFIMDFFYLCSYHRTIHFQCCIQQLLRFLLKKDHFIPGFTFYRSCQLLPDLFIGHKCRFSGLVITKISQMDHIGQYIISALYILCIIFECRCIDFHRCTGQHFYDRCFQSIIIHINKRHDCFIGRCFRPVTLKFTFKHHADYCSRIINLTVLQKISIIPSLHFMKILLIFFRKIPHLIFCKSDIRCKIART